MPARHFLIDSKTQKNFSKLPKHIQRRIVEKYSLIQKNPLIGIKLHGNLSVYSKLRVGDYRIVYRFDEKISTVVVVKIEHRKGVYR